MARWRAGRHSGRPCTLCAIAYPIAARIQSICSAQLAHTLAHRTLRSSRLQQIPTLGVPNCEHLVYRAAVTQATMARSHTAIEERQAQAD